MGRPAEIRFCHPVLSELADEGLLRFDSDLGHGSWDLARNRAKGYTDNVVDLMVAKLGRLSLVTQQALQQFACLGNSAAFDLLSALYGNSLGEMHDCMWEAVQAGLIYRSETSYRFLHDRVQEAAYSFIPQEQRAAAHLQIGTLLTEHTPAENLRNQYSRS